MSQILTDNDDTRSVAASDFVQLEFDQDQPDEVSDQQEVQVQHQLQPELPQFGLHQNTLDWTMNSGSSARDYDNDELKEQKLMMMITNLEVKNQTLQAKVENLELKAENRSLKESSEQKENYQELEAKINLLSTQNEQQQKKLEQLESINQKLEERLSTLELQTTEKENGVSETLDGKMEKLKDEFAIMLAEQLKQKQMIKQFNSLEHKLKEAEQRAQMEKNKFEEIIRASQQNMEKFVDQVIGNNQVKLDFMWGHLLTKSKILANPKGTVWSGLKTKEASISGGGLKAASIQQHIWQGVFATDGYPISVEQCRKDNFQFPGTIVYYFEAKITTTRFPCFSAGFTDGSKPGAAADGLVGGSPNCYGIAKQDAKFYGYWLSGKGHDLECQIPSGSIDAGPGATVVGCGILLNAKNELAVFFTLDGILIVKTRISPMVDRLYPTVHICAGTSVDANFGDNLAANPFKYDIDKCPAWVFE